MVVDVFSYWLRNMLTDYGMVFADQPENRARHPEIEAVFDGHVFGRLSA